MDTQAAVAQVAREVRERGEGFSVEGYEYATSRLVELLPGLRGLALKTAAGRANAEGAR